MSFRVVLFDVDGTLVDSVDLHARAWQEAFDHFGKHVAFDAVRAQIGKGGDQIIPHFLSPREVSAIGDKLDRFREQVFKRNYLPQVRAFPKTRELCQRLVDDDVQIAIASSSKEHELKHYLEVARITDFVSATTSASDVEATKPHPDAVRSAMARVGNPAAAKVRMIGDSPWDVEAAHNAGIACIAVLSGGFSEADLKRAGADTVFASPADLLEDYQRFRAVPPLSGAK